MSSLIELAFKRRGYDDTFFEKIDNGEHQPLKDIDALASQLKTIYDDQTKIVVLPDFDMDGVMSGVVGYAGLCELGFNVELFIPTPSEGYGFRESTIDELMVKHPDVQTILTCDNGITCFDGIAYARQKGLDVLVTDHHKQPLGDVVEANVIVNPMRYDETYEHPAICGAFTLWQCLYRYAELYTTGHYYMEQIERLRLFAGIGTISDMMPVLYENRVLVRESLSFLRQLYMDPSVELEGSSIYTQPFNNMRRILEILESMGKIPAEGYLDEDFYGFQLAPMVNSAKRLDGDMFKVFGAFFSPEPDDYIMYLILLNDERKQLVTQYFEELEPFNGSDMIYVSEANSGILGLLAMKKMTETGIPTVVVRKDGSKYHGSGRSPEWYSFNSRVSKEGFFVAGHEGAFGIGFTDIHEMKAAQAFLEKDVFEIYNNLDVSVKERPIADVVIGEDVGIDICQLWSYYKDSNRLRPFGSGLPAFTTGIVFPYDEAQVFFMGNMKQHVKFTLEKDFTIICWNAKQMMLQYQNGDMIRVSGKLSVNHYNDTYTLTLIGDLV